MTCKHVQYLLVPVHDGRSLKNSLLVWNPILARRNIKMCTNPIRGSSVPLKRKEKNGGVSVTTLAVVLCVREDKTFLVRELETKRIGVLG